jgi:hypothetical protein
MKTILTLRFDFAQCLFTISTMFSFMKVFQSNPTHTLCWRLTLYDLLSAIYCYRNSSHTMCIHDIRNFREFTCHYIHFFHTLPNQYSKKSQTFGRSRNYRAWNASLLNSITRIIVTIFPLRGEVRQFRKHCLCSSVVGGGRLAVSKNSHNCWGCVRKVLSDQSI